LCIFSDINTTLIKYDKKNCTLVSYIPYVLVSQQKKSAVRKNQHSEKYDKEIRHHQPFSPAATNLCPVTKTFSLTFLAVVVVRAMAGFVAVEVAVAGGAVAVAIALAVAVAVAVAVARGR
jgi:hypothetical protein